MPKLFVYTVNERFLVYFSSISRHLVLQGIKTKRKICEKAAYVSTEKRDFQFCSA